MKNDFILLQLFCLDKKMVIVSSYNRKLYYISLYALFFFFWNFLQHLCNLNFSFVIYVYKQQQQKQYQHYLIRKILIC